MAGHITGHPFRDDGFVIGGFLSKDVFDLRAGLPQMAIITPVMVFVTLICIAGMLTALACHRALGQAATVNEEIGELWKDER